MHREATGILKTENWPTKGRHLALPLDKGEGSPSILHSLTILFSSLFSSPICSPFFLFFFSSIFFSFPPFLDRFISPVSTLVASEIRIDWHCCFPIPLFCFVVQMPLLHLLHSWCIFIFFLSPTSARSRRTAVVVTPWRPCTLGPFAGGIRGPYHPL